jgi:hypothetical protein
MRREVREATATATVVVVMEVTDPTRGPGGTSTSQYIVCISGVGGREVDRVCYTRWRATKGAMGVLVVV